MPDFPDSADKIRLLAMDLVKFLKATIRDTHDRPDWTDRNISMLQEFSACRGAASFPGDGGKQFLWDFIAYVERRGVLLAAESEHNRQPGDVEHDFEKLLYVRSPLKLMLCRVKGEEDADKICSDLSNFARDTCTEFSPAEVFIIYCVWWAGTGGTNRDRAYIMQIDGQPNHVPMGSGGFEALIV